MNQSSERHHLARQVEAKESLFRFPKAMFELAFDEESWPRGRQVEGNEGVDLLAARGHAFVSACCALRHVLAAQPGGTT